MVRPLLYASLPLRAWTGPGHSPSLRQHIYLYLARELRVGVGGGRRLFHTLTIQGHQKQDP